MFVRSNRILLLLSPFLVIWSRSCHVFAFRESKAQHQSRQPNIVVIIGDDIGWNDFSFHGADQIPTPNIDALAYNGVILKRHYVLPTCTPSRTAFFTGRYPIRTGMQGEPLVPAEPRAIPLNVTLLPEYLSGLGYKTHMVGKWHLGYFSPNRTPSRRGFETYFGYYSGYIQYFNHSIPAITGFPDHMANDLHCDEFDKLSAKFESGYFTDMVTDEAEKIIEAHNGSRPLYLHISHLAAHSNGIRGSDLEVRDMKVVNETLGYIKNFNRRKFAGVITALDESVGRVVSALKKAKILNNTIILFFSDNGAQTHGHLENYGSNYPLYGMKTTMFEGGIRSAALIYSPLIEKSSRVFNQLIHVTDWLPTLYSAARGDADTLKDLDGVDQWAAISADRKSNRDSLLVNIDERENDEAAIVGRYKLVKRTLYNGYEGYFGDSGNSDSYPMYNFGKVLNSPVALAIANVTGNHLSVDDMLRLRSISQVSCLVPKQVVSCQEGCLFDIYADPCETQDLSYVYPRTFARLQNFIDEYKAVMVKQTNAHQDPAGFPKHFNGTWMPWLSDDQVFESPISNDVEEGISIARL